MSAVVNLEKARQAWAGFLVAWQRWTRPTPVDGELFRRRVRFVERGLGLWVKAALLLISGYFLFVSDSFYKVMQPREDLLNVVRSFIVLYGVLGLGAAFVILGMRSVSLRVLERVVYTQVLLDGIAMSALCLVTLGFDSSLFWLFPALMVRAALVVPHVDVQATINVIVVGAYVTAGLIERGIGLEERNQIDSVNITRVSTRLIETPDAAGESAEAVLLRVLLLLAVAACCAGVRVMLDRRRLEEIEAREFGVKEEQLRAAGRLAAEIAHQLKNPLGIINNVAYTLQRSHKTDARIVEQTGIIREEVMRSDRILTELMGYAQLAEGRVERVQLTEVLDHCVAEVWPPGVEFAVRVHRDYGPAIPPLLGHRGHYAEICANLLTNATEAMNGQGEVFLSVHAGDDYSVVLRVRDTGPGIPAELHQRIFESYFTTKDRGTGLGLGIVKHNCELYGGSVHVENGPGSGACFVVTLPARTAMRLRL